MMRCGVMCIGDMFCGPYSRARSSACKGVTALQEKRSGVSVLYRAAAGDPGSGRRVHPYDIQPRACGIHMIV